jgi:hypothetical protein
MWIKEKSPKRGNENNNLANFQSQQQLLSDSEDEPPHNHVYASFKQVRYMINMISTFQTLMMNGQDMFVEKHNPITGETEADLLENQNILGLARLLSSLMFNSNIQQASQDEEWIQLAT